MLVQHRALPSALMAVLLASACADVRTFRRLSSADGLAQGGTPLPGRTNTSATVLFSGERVPSPPPDVLSPYLDFLRRKQDELSSPRMAERDRRVGERALLSMRTWVYSHDERALAGTTPEKLYSRCWLEASAAERRETKLANAREAKLDEYWRWALRQSGDLNPRFSRPGKEWLVTESPLYEASRDTFVRAVLDWAMAHVNDPIFLERNPSEVALYLLARHSALASVVHMGTLARPHLDYTPDLASHYTLEQLAAELLVGFIPGVGTAAMALEVTAGITITGRQLEAEDRLLAAFAVLIPFTRPVLLRGGEQLGTALGRTALITGHSLHEAHVLARVASHLGPGDIAEIERILRGVSAGRHLTPEEFARLNAIARGLEVPLARLGELVRQGGKAPLLGSRVATNGAPLTIGSAEHMAQCWVDYQFRFPGRNRRFSYAVDPAWEKLYRSIIENSAAGGEFEKAVLGTQKYQKNTIPLMPPPESKMQGFIPDAVKGNPSDLVWGQPYHFVEAKGRQEMALTGNLKAMLDYVSKHGGHVEIWFRSSKHPAGPTKVTQPLQDVLESLQDLGKAQIQRFPE